LSHWSDEGLVRPVRLNGGARTVLVVGPNISEAAPDRLTVL
jgi:hypothetical protein